MSRTYRKESYQKYLLRKPHVFNEKKQLGSLLADLAHDEDFIEIPVAKLNRAQSKYSTLDPWAEDKVVSAYYETDWKL